MKYTNKLISILFAFVLILSLCACGNSKKGSELSNEALIGYWYNLKDNYDFPDDFDLYNNFTCSFGQERGQWSVNGDNLIIVLGNKSYTYKCLLSSDENSLTIWNENGDKNTYKRWLK